VLSLSENYDFMKKPSVAKMIRAPFLSSIIAPIVAGSLLAGYINDHFLWLNFLVVLVIGVGLHVATNVYNDIYDTIQGTDKVNVHRNENSGGSGVLLDNPGLMGTMFRLARTGLVMAVAGALVLSFLIRPNLLPLLWILVLLSVFFSKYYTAPPVKLAYRGLGEFFVWFAFGPMAILIAAVSQQISFHPMVVALMPATGLSTLSILLAGQLIDLDADRAGGKHGVASRLGTRFTSILYLLVQLTIVSNMIFLYWYYPGNSWVFLLVLIPYVIIFPKAATIILKHHHDAHAIKEGAKFTVLTHIGFSLMLLVAFLMYG
jgi:1,4-dihydroxy-2-naphthoate polyprenyltransferase